MTVIKIQFVVNKHDPQGLLRMGAPEDEYLSEAEMILNSLHSVNSLEECHNLVYNVFENMFGTYVAGDKKFYLALAEEIWLRKNDKWS